MITHLLPLISLLLLLPIRTKAAFEGSECGKTKKCVEYPAKCLTSGSSKPCEYLFSYKPTDDLNRLVMELQTHRSTSQVAYISVGFSSDNQMGDDAVTHCAIAGDSVEVHLSKNPGKSNIPQTNLKSQEKVLDLEESEVTASYVYCRFSQKSSPNSNDLFSPDLSQKVYILLARGPISSPMSSSRFEALDHIHLIQAALTFPMETPPLYIRGLFYSSDKMIKYDCSTSASKRQTMCSTLETASANSMTELTNRQVHRLRSVLKQDVEIHGRENFPTLRIALHQLILLIKKKIVEADLNLTHVKMNGGAASYVFCKTDDFIYSDIDLIFPVRLANEHDFEKIRVIILQCLLELMPESTRLMNPDILKDIYIRKMIKVTDQDRWSLFCLHNDYGKCIEFKFVDTMRRPFEFSVDSFQITLNSLLDNFYESHPTIQAESMFGDFHQALIHLNNRQIDTHNPEEIRGGGLLKYCFLLARGYHATTHCRGLEKYMCSRFFIDFSDISEQELKLHAFLENHFGGDCRMKSHYLHILFRVIRESTVCLMGHERRQTLAMVDRLRSELSYALYCANTAEHSNQQESEMAYVPRQTLLYLPPNASQWIPVV